MSTIFECRAKSFGLLAAACVLASIGVASTAEAAVVISAGATNNIACVSNVCTPTKKDAILNVTQLQNLLASGNVQVTTAGALAARSTTGCHTSSPIRRPDPVQCHGDMIRRQVMCCRMWRTSMLRRSIASPRHCGSLSPSGERAG